jgi:hypothetical protein
MATERYGITDLTVDQNNAEQTVNGFFDVIELLVNMTFIDRQTAPPGSPSDGDVYLVDGTGTGDWAGEDDNIAMRINGAWYFVTPTIGDRAWVQDDTELILYNGTNWVSQPDDWA